MRRYIFFIMAILIFFGCTDDTEKQFQKKATEVEKKLIDDTFDNINKTEQDVFTVTKDSAVEVIEKSDEIKDKVLDSSKELVKVDKNTTKEIGKKVDNFADKTVKSAANITAGATKELSNIDFEAGKIVYKKCISCHGAKANIKVLNKSDDISKWTQKNITNALSGYKDGTYGGTLKSIMTALVKTISEEDMKDVSAYIVNLGKISD